MSDDPTELSALFDELVDLDDAERAERLGEIGGRDSALRARLEAMLAADAEATGRLREHEAVVQRSLAAAGERSERDPLGLIDTMVGRYRVDALLGAGGMGIVYRATDARLGRPAALKFLPPVWSLDERAKQRFLHEARAASSLDHPNVCTIYEADEAADGTLYIAMAFYEGETLRDRLERGPLDVDAALDLAAHAAQGLAAAHAQGLVHRDIKPANLLVTADGVLKILDFGVAKAVDIGLTMTEQRPGTMAYMAPEQARGDAVDGRADLWSLGVVLYEMLTGERPAGAGHATEPVPAPSTLRAAVPASADALMLQLLAYSPQDRPARAEDLLAGLDRNGDRTMPVQASRALIPARGRAVSYAGVGILIAVVGIGSYVYLQDGSAPGLASEAAAASPRFIAVLPFDNNSPNSENEYFADGVTDDILTHLAQVPDFSVVSRTTTMGYKGSEKRVQEIADELGVQYVLEGSVRRLEDRVRISAQLVDARTDQHLWADAYNRQLEDIFAVQAEIAQSIAAALEARLSASVAERIERQPTDDLEAYDLFLIGRENYYRYDLEGTERAMDLFGRALERDPEFALARAWLALAHMRYHVSDGMEASWADSAVAGARQAVAQRPDLAAAYTALGSALTFTGRYGEAMPILQQALELNPNDSHAADILAVAHSHLGSWDEAIRVTRRALELENARLNLSLHGDLAWYSLHLGLLDRAQAALEPALALWPDNRETIDRQGWIDLLRGERDAARRAAKRLAGFAAQVPRAGLHAAQLFVFLGDIESARDVAEVAYAQSPTAIFDWFSVDVLYGYTLERTGNNERAHAVLAEAERHAHTRIEAGSERRTFRYSLARIHALRAETDAAFRWLDEAIRFGWNVAAITASDPLLETLHGDPRFQSALDRMEHELAPMRDRVEREGL